MATPFLSLPQNDRAQILQVMAERLGRTAQVLEKDVWICEVLQILFAVPGAKRMAFKGGTALSKVYRVIKRFSEDIDVSIDYRDLGITPDPLAEKLSGNQIKIVSQKLKQALAKEIENNIILYLKTELKSRYATKELGLDINSSGESIRVS